MAINAGTVNSALELNTGPWSNALKTAGKDLKIFADKSQSASKRIDGLGGSFKTVGGTLTKFVSVPLAGVGAVLTKFAGDFEEGSNKVATIADTTVMSMEDIQGGVLSLSDDVGIAANELNETLYQTISATGDTANALGYVEIASKAAVGGFTDTTTAVDGLTTVLNAYGMKGTEAMKSVSDQMLTAQNFGKTTFGEMASSIGNVIPISASLDVSTQELFASIATLTKNGIQTGQAVTGLKAAYSNILKPTKDAADLSADLGLEFNAAHLKSVGWAKFLDEIREKTDGNADKMATLFGSVEGLNAVTVLATTGSKDFSGALDAMGQSAGATEEAFQTMDQGVNDGFEDTLNSLKNLGIELGQTLLPYVNQIIGKVQEWIEWFKSLDDGTKELIVKIGMVVAAIGPVFLIIGQVVSVVGTIAGVIGPVIGAVTGLGAAFTAAGGGIAGVSAVLAALGGPVTLAVAAIAGITAGGVALYNHFKQDAIPAVQLFGDETSEATKKAVGAYMDLDKEAGQSLMNLKLTGQTVSEETKNTLVSNFEQMGQQIKEGTDKHFQETYSTMETFFTNSSALSEEEEAEALSKMKENNTKKKEETDSYVERINEILTTASNEKRALTESEQQEINAIQQTMKENAVNVLSENELEARAIMERMRQQSDEMTALQAADVVKNITEQTNQAIEQANKQYDETIKAIIKQRDEAGTITAEQADKLIKDAKRQRDETVKNAEDMRTKVVENAKQQAGEHVNEVNWETGEVKSKWQILKEDIAQKIQDIKQNVSDKWNEMKENAITKWTEIKTDINNKWTEIQTNIKNIVQAIKQNVLDKWNMIKSITQTVFKAIKTFFTTIWNAYKTLIQTEINLIKKIITTVWNVIKSITVTVFDAIKTYFTELWNTYKKIIDTTINLIKDIITTAWNAIKDTTEMIWNKLREFIDETLKTISGIFDNIWNGILERITNIINNIYDTVTGILLDIQMWVKGKWNTITNALVNPIKNAWDGVSKWVNKIKESVTGAINKIKKLVGLNSKSGGGGYSSGGNGGGFSSPPAGSGYAGGTNDADPGWRWVGEEGPELLWFKGGEKVIPAEDSLSIAKNLAASNNIPIPSKQEYSGSGLDYDRIGKTIAKYIKPSINMTTEINNADTSSPSQTRQEQEILLRDLRLLWR